MEEEMRQGVMGADVQSPAETNLWRLLYQNKFLII